ncbi:MAG TPA: hypothetical protein VFR10_01035 [bacterium]|nr:hypothetical protein [bacterium]
MKSLLLTILGLSFVAVLLEGRPAVACSCMETPPEEMFANADAVFRGTPISYIVIDANNDYYIYFFDVTACWKGNVGEIVSFSALVDENICGIFIAPGNDVIVYAHDSGGTLWTNLCSVVYGGNQEHLNFLGEPGCGPVSVEENSWGSVKALYR